MPLAHSDELKGVPCRRFTSRFPTDVLARQWDGIDVDDSVLRCCSQQAAVWREFQVAHFAGCRPVDSRHLLQGAGIENQNFTCVCAHYQPRSVQGVGKSGRFVRQRPFSKNDALLTIPHLDASVLTTAGKDRLSRVRNQPKNLAFSMRGHHHFSLQSRGGRVYIDLVDAVVPSANH